MKKLLVGGLVIVSLFLVGVTQASASTTWYVDMDAMGAADGSTPTNAYTSIQSAIDAVTTVNGDTIEVAASSTASYVENVTVNKEVILHGANVGIDARGARGTESVVDGGGSGATFVVTSPNVVIDGFTIRGAETNQESGVMIQHQNNVQILNNIITDNAIGVYPGGNNITIRQNLFDANNRPGAAGGVGIYTDFLTDNLLVDKNEFKNHLNNNPVIFGATALPNHTGLVFSDNIVHDNYWGGIIILSVSGGTFSGNTITATDATGLSFEGGNSSIVIDNNTITNSARGIRVRDAGYTFDSPSQPFGPNSAFTFSGNTFSGNTEYNVGLLPGGYSGTEFDAGPVITLNGDASMSVFTSNGYTEPGASATDNMGDSIPVIITGSVNDTVPGTYSLDYSATDIFGHTSTSTRSVNVVAASGGGGGGSSSNSNSNSNAQANLNAGEVLGALSFNFANLTPEERQVQIAAVTSQLTDLMNQLLVLLQQQLAAAIAAGSY